MAGKRPRLNPGANACAVNLFTGLPLSSCNHRKAIWRLSAVAATADSSTQGPH